MENWKDVVGYEGIYEVSDQGKVKSKPGKTTFTELHGVRHWNERILKPKTDKGGYKRVTLWKDGKPKDFLVHRLVALAFLEKPEGKEIVNHKDCKVDNNEVDNLEWCTYAENLMHAYKNDLNKSPNKVELINKATGEKTEFYSMAEASRFMGKGHSYVSNTLKRGKTETRDFIISGV